jgi:signal transduction histidine kinase
VAVLRDGDMLRCSVSDDGRGGADIVAGRGLVGLRDRAEAAGGTLSVLSPPGGGTVVTASLPLNTMD